MIETFPLNKLRLFQVMYGILYNSLVNGGVRECSVTRNGTSNANSLPSADASVARAARPAVVLALGTVGVESAVEVDDAVATGNTSSDVSRLTFEGIDRSGSRDARIRARLVRVDASIAGW